MFDQAVALLDQASALYDRAQPYLIALLLLIIVVALAANAIANRGMPRVGGKIGRRTADAPAPPAPEGSRASTAARSPISSPRTTPSPMTA